MRRSNGARRALLPLADAQGFELELQNGVLNVMFEEPVEARFVGLAECAGPADLGLGDGEKF